MLNPILFSSLLVALLRTLFGMIYSISELKIPGHQIVSECREIRHLNEVTVNQKLVSKFLRSVHLIGAAMEKSMLSLANLII
jgi:hypothetical protein